MSNIDDDFTKLCRQLDPADTVATHQHLGPVAAVVRTYLQRYRLRFTEQFHRTLDELWFDVLVPEALHGPQQFCRICCSMEGTSTHPPAIEIICYTDVPEHLTNEQALRVTNQLNAFHALPLHARSCTYFLTPDHETPPQARNLACRVFDHTDRWDTDTFAALLNATRDYARHAADALEAT